MHKDISYLSIPITGKTPFLSPSPMPAFSNIGSAVCSLYCLLMAYSATAQPSIRFNFRHLSPKSGLSSVYVREIAQDPYGYVWAGTQDGLNRFDGRNFTLYNNGIPGRHGLTGEDTRDLLTDTLHHLLWEINSFGGIDGIDYITGNAVYAYRQRDDRNTADVVFNSLALDGDRLYIGSTAGLFVLHINSRKLEKAAGPNPLRAGVAPPIDNLLRDKSGRLWLFCRDEGVLLLKDSGSILASLPASEMNPVAAGIQFYDCTFLQNGNVLTATSSGLRIISCSREGNLSINNDPYPEIAFSRGRDVYACRQDRHGYVWFSTAGCLIRAVGNKFEFVKEHTIPEETGWLDAVYCISFDKYDNVWLGCQAGLAVAKNTPSCFVSMHGSALPGTTIRHTYYLNPVDDSTLFCCAQEGVYKVDPSKGEVVSLDNGNPYYQAFFDPFRQLLISGTGGTFIYRGGRKIAIGKVYPEFGPLGKQPFNSHCSSGDSLLIFGTRTRGIVVWNYKRRTVRVIDRHTPEIWLKDNYVTNVYTDSKGMVWILGYKSVSVLDFGRRSIHSVNTYDPVRNTFYSLLFDICEAGGRYYLASYGAGVLVLDSAYRLEGLISMKEGLSANSVYKIIPYQDSLLFITTNHGLSILDVRTHYSIRNFYESDGLHSDNFEEYSGAVYNGIVYAGGVDGVSLIDPSRFTAAAPPPAVYIRHIEIETPRGVQDTSNLLLTSLAIPSDALQTTVYLSSLNYQNPGRSRLAYRIKELKGNWIDMGSRDFVPLIGISPGRYTLQIRSANQDEVWSDTPLQLTLDFLPKWYQTLWFKLLVGVLIVSLLYLLYLYRIRQIQKQQQIRREIASDLHDDIGSTLNTVKIFTHLAKREQQSEYYLSRIEDSLTEASAGLRDMIWVLDDSGDTVRDLAERIQKFALPVAQGNNILFGSTIGEGLGSQTLSKTVKRNLLLIAKETINNSFKYSRCLRIEVSIELIESKLRLSIRDDGNGFDVANSVSGNGLENIRQRARQIGYHARIHSSPEGTIVEVMG